MLRRHYSTSCEKRIIILTEFSCVIPVSFQLLGYITMNKAHMGDLEERYRRNLHLKQNLYHFVKQYGPLLFHYLLWKPLFFILNV